MPNLGPVNDSQRALRGSLSKAPSLQEGRKSKREPTPFGPQTDFKLGLGEQWFYISSLFEMEASRANGKKKGSATDRLTEVLTNEIMSVKMKSLSCVRLTETPGL